MCHLKIIIWWPYSVGKNIFGSKLPASLGFEYLTASIFTCFCHQLCKTDDLWSLDCSEKEAAGKLWWALLYVSPTLVWVTKDLLQFKDLLLCGIRKKIYIYYRCGKSVLLIRIVNQYNLMKYVINWNLWGTAGAVVWQMASRTRGLKAALRNRWPWTTYGVEER